MFRDRSGANPNPLIVADGAMRQTSRQIQDHLLCGCCEQLFNRRGEAWMLANCFRSQEGTFGLYEQLTKQPPILTTEAIAFYAGTSITGIESLIYFAASVFWRAAVHTWRIGSARLTISLGPRYEGALKEYLLGKADFPDYAVLLPIISQPGKARPVAYLPIGGRDDDHWQYDFLIPGVRFNLLLGRKVPPQFHRFCVAHSPEKIISVSDEVLENAFENFARHVSSCRHP